MAEHEWPREFPAGITVCDREGIILEMNDQSARVFAEQGGKRLIGTSLLECHPEPARSQLAELLASGLTNVYTLEKMGMKKLIYQSPWYRSGQYAGLVELSIEIPAEMPHFVRQG